MITVKFNKFELQALRAGNRLQAISLFMRRTQCTMDMAKSAMSAAIAKYNITVPTAKVVNTGVDIHQDKDGHLTLSVDSDHYDVAMQSQSRVIDDIERWYQLITIRPK